MYPVGIQATIVMQMRAKGVQQDRNNKEKVERRGEFPVYSLVYIHMWGSKISIWAKKWLLLIPHLFGIIKILKRFGLEPEQYTPPRSHFALLSYQFISGSLIMPSYPHASLDALLEISTLPEGLANALSNSCIVLGHQGCLPKARSDTGDPTGAKPKSGEPVLCLVTFLVVFQVMGSEAICLLVVQENTKIVLVHSIFTISPNVYSADVQLWGVVGDLPKDGTQALLLLTGIHFSPNVSFRGVSRTYFETHIGGLNLKNRRKDAHSQQVAVESDEGLLKVLSLGLCFLPSKILGGVPELREGILIDRIKG